MNRLSFLKTLGVGIATAVITPKIFAEIDLSIKETPKDKEWSIKWAKYAYNRVKELKPFMSDLCMDKDMRQWRVVSIYENIVTLYALEPNPEPSCIEVKDADFPDYFIILGNSYSEGTGGPR